MKAVFARNYCVQALTKFPLTSLSGISFGVSLKASNYSTSCQPSLEVGDISTSEVHEESHMQQTGLGKAPVERRDKLTSKRRLVQNVQGNVKPDQQDDLKRSPLRKVVRSCEKRWFKEHLRNAEQGDSDAQIMVGHMISHGYGVLKDSMKGEEWLKRGRSRQKQSKESLEKKTSEDEKLYFM